MLPNPWSLAEENYAINQLVEGTVTRIVTYGAFIEIEPGIEGLLHISQLSRDNVEDVSELISEGDVHLLRIISLDPTRQRIGLSLKGVSASEQIEWMSQREVTEEAEDVTEDVTEEGDVEAGVASDDLESEESAEDLVDEDVDTGEAGEAESPTDDSEVGEVTDEVEIDDIDVVDVAAAVDQALAELDEEE